MRGKIEELNLLDDFLMTGIANNVRVKEKFFRKFLSVLLEQDIGKVTVSAQKMIPAIDTDYRGVRLDVEVSEVESKNGIERVANVYDIEPHTKNDTDFPRSNRFRQAKIDSKYMKAGDNDFKKMPGLYVITITNFDIFKKDYMIYTFRNSCVEAPDLKYDDGLNFVYFNTKGNKGGSKSIENLLRYMQNSNEINVVDENTKELSGYVKEVKSGEDFKEAFMTIGDHLDWEREEGREEGRAEERKNTERERQRAEKEQKRAEKEKLRAEKAEAEIKVLKDKIARLEAEKV
ncbi:MAG: hypothetical protein K5987_06720 [Lachnospiraceae bacterium]|nr:hypothetical protein [Lachnospiraceae bacterium]